MPRNERAKQFAPFNALKGLQKALREKELEHNKVNKKELFEEMLAEINQTIKEIRKDDLVQVMFYLDGLYKTLQGKVIIDFQNKTLFIDKYIIKFEDIYKIRIVK